MLSVSEKSCLIVKHNIYRETWAEIDLDAIGYNLEQIKQKLPQHCNIIAVVKANGYGHGAVQIARKALQSGAVALAVALLEEALILREAGIVAPILVFGRISPEAAAVRSEERRVGKEGRCACAGTEQKKNSDTDATR